MENCYLCLIFAFKNGVIMFKFLKNRRVEFRNGSNKSLIDYWLYLLYVIFVTSINFVGLFNWIALICIITNICCLIFVSYFHLKLVKKEFDNGLPTKWN